VYNYNWHNSVIRRLRHWNIKEFLFHIKKTNINKYIKKYFFIRSKPTFGYFCDEKRLYFMNRGMKVSIYIFIRLYLFNKFFALSIYSVVESIEREENLIIITTSDKDETQ
jgi:hypothetical protein